MKVKVYTWVIIIIILCVVIQFFALNQNKSYIGWIKFPVEGMTIFLTKNGDIFNVPEAKEFDLGFSSYKCFPIRCFNFKPMTIFFKFITASNDRVNGMMNMEFNQWIIRRCFIPHESNFFNDSWSFPMIFQIKQSIKLFIPNIYFLIKFNV